MQSNKKNTNMELWIFKTAKGRYVFLWRLISETKLNMDNVIGKKFYNTFF